MKLTVLDQPAHTLVALEGRMNHTGVAEIEMKFVAATTGLHKPTIVDLSGVPFIDSHGVGVLVSAARTLKARGVAMVLLNPQPFVENVLNTASIPSAVPIARGIEQAMRLLNES
jgi:anti-sigma B factor antagonist